MDWLKKYKTFILEGGLVILLLCGTAVLGQYRMVAATAKPSGETAGYAETEGIDVYESESELESESQTEAETEAVSEDPSVPQLSEKQKAVVEELLSYLNSNQLQEAAKVLIDKEQQFVSLFYTTMEGKDYLYRDGELYEDLEGEGLVFQKPGTVFYGSFAGGYPEGENLALQAVNLDAPRYDYSDGTWSNGYMNGFGTIGYQYYQGIEGEEPWDVKKEGNFAENLMDGEIVYSSTDAKGQGLTWYLNAVQGVTAIDDRWRHNASEGQYLLISETDDSSAYILNEADKDSIRWMNLIPWARED